MKRMTRLLLAAALGCSALLQGCGKQEAPPAEPMIRPVRYQQVRLAGAARERIFTGVAQAGTESRWSFKVAGTLSTLNVKVGDGVRQGQVIAELDPRDYQLRVQEASAALAQARAELENAEANLKRIRGLYENSNASEADLDATLTRVQVTEATIDSLEKQKSLAELQVDYCVMKAPEGGLVSEVPVEINENVQAGQVIAVVTSGSLPEVQVDVPEVLIAEVQQGSAVQVTFASVPGRVYAGKVTEVGVSASRALSTFPVTVVLQRPDRRILPGMAAEVRFRFGRQSTQDRFIVPTHAVAQDRQGTYVYVLEEQGEGKGAVRRREVQVGEVVREGIEILNGLEDGDLIVTAGVSKIQDGETVRIREEDRG